jgi:hypothetical protein
MLDRVNDPLQALHDDLRALDAKLATAQRTLQSKAGTRTLDWFKSVLAVLASFAFSQGKDVFPSTEDASLDLIQAQRIAAALRSTGAALAARGLLRQGAVDGAVDFIVQALDDFPHEEHMSHRGFATWTGRVTAMRLRCETLRREIGSRPVGYRA